MQMQVTTDGALRRHPPLGSEGLSPRRLLSPAGRGKTVRLEDARRYHPPLWGTVSETIRLDCLVRVSPGLKRRHWSRVVAKILRPAARSSRSDPRDGR